MASDDQKGLPALSRLYAAGDLGWRDIAEQTDASFGDLLVELAQQGLQLPTFTAAKTPTQAAMFDAELARAAKAKKNQGDTDDE